MSISLKQKKIFQKEKRHSSTGILKGLSKKHKNFHFIGTLTAFRHKKNTLSETRILDLYPRRWASSTYSYNPVGFEHQPSKAFLWSLAACQVIIFFRGRRYNDFKCSSLAIRFRGSICGFSFANLHVCDIVSLKAININKWFKVPNNFFNTRNWKPNAVFW